MAARSLLLFALFSGEFISALSFSMQNFYVRAGRSCKNAWGTCISRKRLRGGGPTRPWREVPLESGEVAFYHRPDAPQQPSMMTATDWKRMDDNDLLISEYPDPLIFSGTLESTDPEIAGAIQSELSRQEYQLELIASENIGSVLTNKYAEGYPGKRYYGGCEHVDKAEQIALDRLKKLFNCAWANVQPHSGAQANQAVFLALAQPGDTILGMSLASGGHLTHGAAPNLSGKWFKAVQYGVSKDTGLIDFDEVEALAREHSPRIIVAGGSAYSRVIDFARFRRIADAVGAYLMVDMAHFAGLVAGGAYPSPLPHAHVVTSTTHKTLRGPRGGVILSNDAELGKRLNSAVFPGLQGGPLMHVIAAKAVAFGEALRPSFRTYAHAVVDNARTLAATLAEGGLAIVSGGTDSHVVLVDLRPKNLTGRAAEAALERAGLTCNKNAVPFDPARPAVTSGIRLGTPAGTTRGLGTAEFRQVGLLILEVLDALAAAAAAAAAGEADSAAGGAAAGDAAVEARVRERVRLLCERFPAYGGAAAGGAAADSE